MKLDRRFLRNGSQNGMELRGAAVASFNNGAWYTYVTRVDCDFLSHLDLSLVLVEHALDRQLPVRELI